MKYNFFFKKYIPVGCGHRFAVLCIYSATTTVDTKEPTYTTEDSANITTATKVLETEEPITETTTMEYYASDMSDAKDPTRIPLQYIIM